MNLQEGGWEVQKIVIGSQNIIKYPGNGFPSSLEIGYTDKKLTFVCVRGGRCIGKSVWGGTLLKEAMMRSRI